MVNRASVVTFACALLAAAALSSFAAEPLRDRRTFAEAMNKVKEGMSEAEVISLVGKPDDVSAQDWQLGIAHSREILRYGVSDHMAAATLGQVGIDRKHKVEWLTGQGLPPREGLFTESELRTLIEALYGLPAANESDYNPRAVIRAVNLLQPLGKTKALAAIGEFLRVSQEDVDEHPREGLFLVLRTLFEVPTEKTVLPGDDELSPPGSMPPMYTYIKNLEEPTDKLLLPRYPIVIEGDIPFLVDRHFGGGTGMPQPASEHVDYFRRYGTLRANPLVPAARPFESLERVTNYPRWSFKSKSDGWLYFDKNELRASLGNQVLRLLDTVHRFESDERGRYLEFCELCAPEYKESSEAKNKALATQASKIAVRWENKASRYTLLDGKFIPPFDQTLHPALSWRPADRHLDIELLIRRQDRCYVELLYADASNQPGRPEARTRVFAVKNKNQPLVEIDGLPLGEMVRLDEGEEVEMELSVGTQILRSPVLKP